jgi:putative Mg2+ transporter-C (MgtC) family protein
VTSDLELVARIIAAAVIGTLLGFERELGGHEPGMRTHALVAMGAAVFTVAGAYGFADRSGEQTDPTRIAAQVATGIGFIGAGAVLRSGFSVRGLTTAATLWVSAAVGVASAAGLYLILAVATVVTLLILVFLRLAKPRMMSSFGGVHRLVRIEYERGHGTLGPVMRELAANRCRIGPLHLEDDDENCHETTGIRRVTITVQTPDESRLAASIAAFERRAEIVAVSIDAPDD